MQQEVRALIALGPLPTEGAANLAWAMHHEWLLSHITPPVSDDEARGLVGLFGPDGGDSCYLLAWRLLHLIETAPHWPLDDCLPADGPAWIQHLRFHAETQAGTLCARRRLGREAGGHTVHHQLARHAAPLAPAIPLSVCAAQAKRRTERR